MAEYSQVYRQNTSGSNRSKGKSPRQKSNNGSRTSASLKEEETQSQQEISAALKELSTTVDKLSHKLDDFIENTSEVLSLSSRQPGSRQVSCNGNKIIYKIKK